MKKRYMKKRLLKVLPHKKAYKRAIRYYKHPTKIYYLLGLILLSFIINQQINYLLKEYSAPIAPLEQITYDLDKIADFNIHAEAITAIKEYAKEKELDFYEVFTKTVLAANFDLESWQHSMIYTGTIKQDKSYEALKNIYQMLLEDLRYFPIPDNLNPTGHSYNYVNTWRDRRTYGGEREHYGTDIMDNENQRGYFPILSITEGYVEKIGWLEKGGYRIGIRSPSGAYFYYAHLYAYADGLQQGDQVKAGQLLGFMGDSGYGVEEGTVGQFPVHLHLGISLPFKDSEEEYWMNPYWILKYLEQNKIKSWY